MIEIDLYSEFYNLVKQIPEGMVTTYGDLAIALGDPISARAVGKMLSENPSPIEIPCHRVVKGDGTIGGFTHPEGIKKKIELLESEGIKIKNNRVENFEKIRFRDFKSDYPLKRILKYEKNVKNYLIFETKDFDGIVSFDVSYAGRKAFYSLFKFDKSLRIDDFKNGVMETNFPYIPTYFSYREGNIFLKVYKGNDLIILDGNGTIHPRGFGLACYVGLNAKTPAIGIAKSLLLGKIVEENVYVEGKIAGFIINKKIVSPGNFVSLEDTKKIVEEILKKGDPIKFAHRESKKLRDEYCRSNNCGPF